MGSATLTVNDGISPVLLRLVKKSRDMSPVMRQVKTGVILPKKLEAWQKSGLVSRTGELEDAVELWHGKKSAGVSVKSTPGHDLVIPKAVFHTSGARKHQYKKKGRVRVARHSRAGRRVRSYSRKNHGSPWGAVKARKFLPTSFSTVDKKRIEALLRRHLSV